MEVQLVENSNPNRNSLERNNKKTKEVGESRVANNVTELTSRIHMMVKGRIAKRRLVIMGVDIIRWDEMN